MYRLLSLFFLFATLGAAAQQMPERSAVRKGNRKFHKAAYDEAISRYEEALAAAPGNFEATYDLGNALYKAERYDKATETLQRAAADSLRSDAERAHAFYNLGNALFKQQKLQEALESYKQSLRLDPSDKEAKYNYAYTKQLLDRQNDDSGGGGDDDRKQDQNQDQQQSGQNGQNGPQDQQDQKQDPNDPDKDGQGQNDPQRQNGENDPQDPSDPNEGDPNEDDPNEGDRDGADPQQQDGQPQPVPAGISPQEQEQMLDAIQAQEDKTQDKLKEKARGAVVRGKRNW